MKISTVYKHGDEVLIGCFDCCSAAVVHDLTLRSAPSFGSFHLIRMLFDDYMRYLAAHKTAAATNKHPMAVWDSKKVSNHEQNVSSIKLNITVLTYTSSLK